jgi:hypothetical protein
MTEPFAMRTEGHLAGLWKWFAVVAAFSVAMPGLAAGKALLLIALWGALVWRSSQSQLSILWFTSVLASLSLSMLVGVFYDTLPANIYNEGFRTLTFFLVFSMGVMLVKSGGVSAEKLDRLIAWIAVLSLIFKIMILVISVTGVMTADQIQTTLGFESVQDDIGLGLQRIQFPADILLQFMIFCYAGGRRRFMDGLVLFAIGASVLLSFSRYLFAAFLASVMLRSFLVRRYDLIAKAAVVLTLLVGVLFSAALATRFTGQGSTTSDSIRTIQIAVLGHSILQYPLLGSGMGSNAHGYIRTAALPFSYEVQWYALTLQLGFLGLVWFLINLIMPPLTLLIRQPAKLALFFTVWCVWAASGFTNPFIVSLGSGFGLTLMLLRLAPGEADEAGAATNPRQPHDPMFHGALVSGLIGGSEMGAA